ncbi:MAG: hypothetical protein HOC74_19325 [Gemmatimonadetes bacterium]|nr:hypothetical protein [Gemmatimonadota bacterium]
MKPGKAKLDLQTDDLREALKGKVRHPYITGQGLAEDDPAAEGRPESSGEGSPGGESEAPKKEV